MSKHAGKHLGEQLAKKIEKGEEAYEKEDWKKAAKHFRAATRDLGSVMEGITSQLADRGKK